MKMNLTPIDDVILKDTPSVSIVQSGLISERYRILAKIGAGGMGDVFLGIQHGAVDFQRLVVIKQIHAHLFHQPNHKKMFVDEASLVASLVHPHIVKIIDFRQTELSFYIVMEYVDGETLKVIHSLSQDKGRPIPFPLGCRLILAACEALQYAHEATSRMGLPLNIIHRDIGLHNLMIDRNGYLKVIDFGIAKSDMQTDVTHPGMLKGNPNYMPPDLFLCEKIDKRVDIYALGLCLYELLTNQRAFLFKKKTELAEVLRQVTQQELAAPSSIIPSLPADLDAIVAKSTAKDREERYASVAQMADELRGVARKYHNEFAEVDTKQWFHENFPEQIRQRIEFEENVLKGADSPKSSAPSIYSYAPPPIAGSGQTFHGATTTASTGGVLLTPRIAVVGGAILLAIISLILGYALFFRTPSDTVEAAIDSGPNLFIRSTPTGADIYIDGKRIDTTDEWGSALRIAPEKPHKILISKDNFQDYTVSLTIPEDGQRRMNVALKSKNPSSDTTSAPSIAPPSQSPADESTAAKPNRLSPAGGQARKSWRGKKRVSAPEKEAPIAPANTPPSSTSRQSDAKRVKHKPNSPKPVPLLDDGPKKIDVPLLDKEKHGGNVPLM